MTDLTDAPEGSGEEAVVALGSLNVLFVAGVVMKQHAMNHLRMKVQRRADRRADRVPGRWMDPDTGAVDHIRGTRLGSPFRMMTTPGFAPGFDAQDDFGDVTAEYSAVRDAAGLVDRSSRLRMLFAGRQPAMTLTGLVTNDVVALRPGEGQFAGALTPKGKVIADVRVFALADGFLVDTSAAAGPGFAAMLKKYVNPRLAKFVDLSAETATIGVFGPEAAVVATLCGVERNAAAALAPFAHLDGMRGGSPCRLVRIPDLGVDGFDVMLPAAEAPALVASLRDTGVAALDAATIDILRVEAGRPAWGVDMDEGTLAQEAALDAPHLAAISFTKGCYTGQETVARVHFRGHVNRELRGLRALAPLFAGSALATEAMPEAGTVRSAVVSPRLGPIALAYVRREVPDGGHVIVRVPGGEVHATVTALPPRRPSTTTQGAAALSHRACLDSAAPTKPTGQPMIAAGRGHVGSSSIFSRWNRAVGALPIATTAPSSWGRHSSSAAAAPYRTYRSLSRSACFRGSMARRSPISPRASAASHRTSLFRSWRS